ncbi:DUF1415 domain-containing protein [Plasmodiophora brassicae]|nr:hypothetical protein PBRA_000196 [Plasmodiophora brassicae]
MQALARRALRRSLSTCPVRAAVMSWINNVVVKNSLCPFARQAVDNGALRLVVSEETDASQIASHVFQECKRIQQLPDDIRETTIIVTPNGLSRFAEYLACVNVIEKILDKTHYDEFVQVATFHPDYEFQDCEPDDPANYTNRSPFPMIHLLRSKEVFYAVHSLPDPDEVWQRNQAVMREKGLEQVQRDLEDCRCPISKQDNQSDVH